MASMVRKQVYLTVEQDRRLRRAADRARRPEAEIIRAALDRELGVDSDVSDPTEDPLWDIVGIAGGPWADLSEQVDHYLYGRPKRKQR